MQIISNKVNFYTPYICVLLLLYNMTGFASSDIKIEPADVLVQVKLLDQRIEELASIMGVKLKFQDSLNKSTVYPRDVFYQGITVFKKIGRIRYEFTRSQTIEPATIAGEYEPKHVHSLLLETHQYMDDIFAYLTKSYPIELSKKNIILDSNSNEDIQPKHVFARLVILNRKLNQLLDFRFSPADTFEQVTLAISYASAILQTVSEERTIFKPEPFEIGRTPSDAYQRLLTIQNKLYICLESVGMLTNKISEDLTELESIHPSDTYDLSTLVLSNLNFLYRNLEKKTKLKPSYYPGKIIPSVVYQRLSILEMQINEIHKLRYFLKVK